MRISDWSSDVCSSDLQTPVVVLFHDQVAPFGGDDTVQRHAVLRPDDAPAAARPAQPVDRIEHRAMHQVIRTEFQHTQYRRKHAPIMTLIRDAQHPVNAPLETVRRLMLRSEENQYELQSIMRSSYAVLCFKKK